MLVDSGKDEAGAVEALKTYFGHLFHIARHQMEGWQQFVVRARDERGDPDGLSDRSSPEGWRRMGQVRGDVYRRSCLCS